MKLGLFLLCFCALQCLVLSFKNFEDVVVSVNLKDPPKYVTGENFFSVCLSIPLISQVFKEFDMTNKRFLKLINHLNPGYLRIGGNMADRLIFSRSTNISEYSDYDKLNNYDCIYENNCNLNYDDYPLYILSGEQWVKVYNFSKNINAKMFFNLNSLLRNNDGSWNSKNARELIAFSNKHGFDVDWHLGNEPDIHRSVFNTSVKASQMAKDFTVLKQILNEYPLYKNSKLVGPDTTRPKAIQSVGAQYLEEFLQSLNSTSILDAVSFHQYSLSANISSLYNFLDPVTFYSLEYHIKIVKNIVEKSIFKNTPLWITETSSAFGGGRQNLSNAFAGTFLWLDKLGLAANYGIDVVVRQSLFLKRYALIDDNYNPTPDYWISILFNKFVGSKVLHCNITAPVPVRLYCHCSKASYGDSPSVTVFGVNIRNNSVNIKIKGVDPSGNVNAYILTRGESSLRTKKLLLNGKLLELLDNGDLPVMSGKLVDFSKPLEMSGYSLAFWTIPVAETTVCSSF